MHNKNMREDFSVLLLGNTVESVRFEVKVLRSLGMSNVRGIVDIEHYCKNASQYTSDIILVHEVCGKYCGIDIIKKIRYDMKSTTPTALLLSERPNAILETQLQELHASPLTRPYTYKDISILYKNKEKTEETEQWYQWYNFTAGKKNSELIGIIYLQLFVKTAQLQNAKQVFLELKNSVALKRLIAITRRSAYETQQPQEILESFCAILAQEDRELASYVESVLFQNMNRPTKNIITRRIHPTAQEQKEIVQQHEIGFQ